MPAYGSPSAQPSERSSSPIDTIPDDEVDHGRTESQQLLSVVKALASNKHKKDGTMAEFREVVESGKQVVETLAGDEGRQIDEEEIRWRQLLQSHLLAILKQNPGGGRTARSTGKNPTRNVLAQAKKLLDDYDRLCGLHTRLTEQSQAVVRRGWQADTEKVERLLGLGKRVSERAVAQGLGLEGANVNGKGEGQNSLEVEEREAEALFREGKEEDTEFRRVAEGVESVVRKTLRVIPREET